MTKLFKWLRNSLIFFIALGLFLFIFVKFYIGAVNVPVFSKDFDSSVTRQRITVAEGFSVSIYAENVENARLLRFTQSGDLLVASTNLNQIVLLHRDANNDGKSDSKRILLDKLNGPNGMDFYQDWLYIAETDAIGRIKFNHETGETIGEYQHIITGLPDGGNHWRKTLRFGPDNLMYVTMGSSCNVCEEDDKRRATMVRYNPDGSNEEIFAKGLRNSAGFDWSPVDGHIYATDNGRDMLGDNFPHCELNKVEQGNHYGWPYANDDKIPDPDYGKNNAAIVNASIAPAFQFQPHNAPLGITFIRGTNLPVQYHNAAVVALHGSWNRSEKDGYKVVTLQWDSNNKIVQKDFLTGLLVDDDVIGRPVDVAEGPDGAIYISDDYANVVYRVAYAEQQRQLTLLKTATSFDVDGFSAEQSLAAIANSEKMKMIKVGAEIFAQFNCISCHNGKDEGAKTLKALGSKYNIETLTQFIERPNPPMPTVPITEQQRQSLAVYLIESYSN